jgi:hypothetical protein
MHSPPWSGGPKNGAGKPDEPGSQGGGMTRDIETLLDLSEWMALSMAQPWQGFQVCGNVEGKLAADLRSMTAADGHAQGGVGVKPWDTGAMAQIAVKQRFAIDLAAGAEAKLGTVACVDLSKIGASPPVRTTTNGAAATNLATTSNGQLEQTLIGLANQMGLDPQRLNRALADGVGVLQSGQVTRLAELSDFLPISSGLRDPLGHVQTQLGNFDPVGNLLWRAGSGFGPFAAQVQEACNFIQAVNLPELGPFLSLTGDFSRVRDRVASFCGEYNRVVDTRLVVSTGPWGSGTLDVEHFPRRGPVSC